MSETRSAAETIYPSAATETPAAADPSTKAQDTPATAAPDTPAPQETTAPASETPTLLTEKPAEEAKPEEPAAPPPEPFEAEKITFPEGVKPDPEVFGKFGEIAKQSGMSQATAQSLMDLYVTVASAEAMKSLDAWKTTREGWVTAVKADKEIGGNNLDDVKRTVAKILDNPELTDPKFREALEITGIGDNPAAIRSLYRWAKALSEGTPVSGDAPSRRAPRSLAEVMYPHLSERQ
jgi:hypothetical protein